MDYAGMLNRPRDYGFGNILRKQKTLNSTSYEQILTKGREHISAEIQL